MNKKAENFQAFLEEKAIRNAFQAEETGDEWETVLFRSQLDIDGNKLPTLLLLDSSIYGILRVLIAPKVPAGESEAAVLRLINGYNRRFKAFKYYLDDAGALVLDVCILSGEGEDTGDMVYAIYDVILRHLNEAYKEIMRSIWS